MKKILIFFLLMTFVINVKALNNYESAIKETTDAFFRKSEYIKYSNRKYGEFSSPEMAAADNLIYTQCADIVNQIYQNTFNIKISSSTLFLGGCAYYQRNNYPDVIRKVWSKSGNLESPSKITVESFVKLVNVGDIIVAIQENGGHTMMVYEVNGEDTLLFESNTLEPSLSRKLASILYGKTLRTLKLTSYLSYLKNSKDVFIIRPFGDDNKYKVDFNSTEHNSGGFYDMSSYSCDAVNTEVHLSESSNCRNRYPKMTINKSIVSTNGIINKSDVNVGDEYYYRVEIENNSSEDYKNLRVVEDISKYVTLSKVPKGAKLEGDKLVWILDVKANSIANLSYKVKVKSNALGEYIVSTGKVCEIDTLTIRNKVTKGLKEEDYKKIIKVYNKNVNLDTKTLINKIYKEVLNIDGILDSFDIEDVVITDHKYTNPKTIYLNKDSKYYDMVYNNYFGGLAKINNQYSLYYWINHKLMASPKDDAYIVPEGYRSPMADTIYEKHFKTGDILVTLEDGVQKEYIFLRDGKNGRFYSKNETFPSSLNSFDYNLLYEKDLYVILRPSLIEKTSYLKELIIAIVAITLIILIFILLKRKRNYQKR